MPVPNAGVPAAGQRVLLRNIAEQRLRDAIMDGTLEPGEVLHDKELQVWLGVSRTPIRDALNELARVGLVEMEPNRFTRVATPRPEEAIEAMQTLGVLLGGIVRLAVPRIDATTRAALVKDLRRVQSDIAEGNVEHTRDLVLRTWERLATQTGNRILEEVYNDTMSGLFFKVPAEIFLELFDQEAMHTDIGLLADAIDARDAVAAELATERVYQLPSITETAPGTPD